MRDGEPRLRVTLLNDGERTQGACGIVLGGEAAIVEKDGAGAQPMAIRNGLRFGDVVNAHGAQSEAGEYIHQIVRRHDDGGGQAHQAARHGPVRQMILGASVVIVEDGLFPEEAGEQQSRSAAPDKTTEYPGRENVQNVRAADAGRQPREIKNESNQRSQVLPAQRGGQPRIDREKLNLNGGIVCQAAQQLIRLNGLTADDIERRCDQRRDADRESLTWRVSWLTFAKTVGFAFSIALPLLLVRRMDREEYGLYKQAFLMVTTAMTVLPLGVPMSAFYFLPRESTRRRETVLNIVLFHVAMGALACGALVLYPSILTAIFHDTRLAPYSAWIGVTILFWITGAFLDIVPVANDEVRLASAFIIGIQASRALIFVGAAVAFRNAAVAARGGGSAWVDPDRRAGVLPGVALCGILARV